MKANRPIEIRGRVERHMYRGLIVLALLFEPAELPPAGTAKRLLSTPLNDFTLVPRPLRHHP